jgi:hypothetical protein
LAIAPYLVIAWVSAIEFSKRLAISQNAFLNANGWFRRAQYFRLGNELAAVAWDPFAGAHIGSSTDLHEFAGWGQSVLPRIRLRYMSLPIFSEILVSGSPMRVHSQCFCGLAHPLDSNTSRENLRVPKDDPSPLS